MGSTLKLVRNIARRLDLPPQPRIRYTRKSTEEEHKQVASHDQQMASMDAKWGRINTEFHFQDSQSGTTFERPGFKDMENFCRLNKQPSGAQGIIEIYDMSRFGRILLEGDEDPYAVVEKIRSFHRVGWEVRFATMEKTGNPMLDFIQQGLHAAMAAEFSKKLSRDTRRGRDYFLSGEGAAKGARWLGGEPPLGTRRVDPDALVEIDGKLVPKPLNRKDHASRGGSILVADEGEMEFLVEGGKMLLAGATYLQIAQYWNLNGVRAEWGQSWEHRGVQSALGNPALIGERHVVHRDPRTGEKSVKVYPAAWGPLIDVEHFQKVKAELTRRRHDGRVGPRSGFTRSLLSIRCARCGVPWYASRVTGNGRKQERVYYHTVGDNRTNKEWVALIKEHGCKHWRIDADTFEEQVMRLILEQRTSPTFVDHLNRVINDRSDLEADAARKRRRAEGELRRLVELQKQTSKNMTQAQIRGLPDAVFWESLEQINRQMAEVQKARDEAIELEKVANSAWDSVRELIDETRNLEAIWKSGDFIKRRQILDWWVRDILIVVDHEPGKLRAKSKHALVFLRTAPTEALDMLVGGRDEGGDGSVSVFGGNTGTRTPLKHAHSCFVLAMPRHKQTLEDWMVNARWESGGESTNIEVEQVNYKRRPVIHADV